jgi:hypothetical protein
VDQQPVRSLDHLRRVVNVVTLATPLGLLLAAVGRAQLRRGPNGTIVAAGYGWRFPAPHASAVTIGDVILLRLDDEALARRPGLLSHEARHSVQWACLAGVAGFPLLYGLASLWSWLRCRDLAMHNLFEVRAGLVDGGYVAPRPVPRPDIDSC